MVFFVALVAVKKIILQRKKVKKLEEITKATLNELEHSIFGLKREYEQVGALLNKIKAENSEKTWLGLSYYYDRLPSVFRFGLERCAELREQHAFGGKKNLVYLRV